jgi:hypothetical protein
VDSDASRQPQFYIRNNKNDRQINQKCGGFRCSRQSQFYIRNNKNDRQIKKNCGGQLRNLHWQHCQIKKCGGQLRNLHWQQLEHSLNKSKMRWIPLHWTASQFTFATIISIVK